MKRRLSVVCMAVLLCGCAGPSQVPTPRPPMRGDFQVSAPSPAATATAQQVPSGSPSASASPTPTEPVASPLPSPAQPPSSPVPSTPAPSVITGPLPEDEVNPQPGKSPDPVIGCGISQEEIAPLYGAFDRVVNSVGRPDQAQYTAELMALLQRFRGDAASCPGPERFDSLSLLAVDIDRAAAAGEADLDAINQFRQVGNAWLDGAGLKASLLS